MEDNNQVPKKKKAYKNSFTAKTLDEKEFEVLTLGGEFEGLFQIDKGFSMMLYGESGSGKTSLAFRLVRELSKIGKVYYNSIEQGFSYSLKANMRKALDWESMSEEDKDRFNRKVVFSDRDSYRQMCAKLKRNGASVVVIDSIQYMAMTKLMWYKLRLLFPKKGFILISHAKHGLPKGEPAQDILFDVNTKIRVEAGTAYIINRGAEEKVFQIIPQKERAKMNVLRGTLFEKIASK